MQDCFQQQKKVEKNKCMLNQCWMNKSVYSYKVYHLMVKMNELWQIHQHKINITNFEWKTCR